MLLKVDSIHVSYGSFQALHGVSLEVEEGQIVALLGSNGAGKSTTIKTISGQLTPTRGDIQFQGESIVNTPIHKRVEMGIIQVPEGRRVFPYLTIEDNMIAGSYNKMARKLRKEKLDYVYSIFPKMYERRKQLAGSLSGGEQQMLAMGRALMSNPKLLMLDEPSMGLAPILVQQIFDIISDLHKAGTTILLVEQNAQMALSIADRAYVLETGNIVKSGDAKMLMNDDDVRKAYLG